VGRRFSAQQTSRRERLIAHHLGGEARARAAGEQAVARIFREQFRRRAVVLAVCRGEDEFAEQCLQTPALFVLKTQREEIEQGGMRRREAGRAEVFERLDDAEAEKFRPDAVHEDARGRAGSPD
jgi:hypothetical protein